MRAYCVYTTDRLFLTYCTANSFQLAVWLALDSLDTLFQIKQTTPVSNHSVLKIRFESKNEF